ncbi:MAG: hypothetical protein PHU61_03135 [Candidatus Absconditabacteria bacterium]|nr:hypothetical protein [Candidatus Absconditabacteria bacterium]MDD3868224.1 hypothetical protein [Candidatus Absconditabacteria bacterium]MDD4714649.1 hypothetical protein [Candidatus Absconditabacteria bacterium]
MESVNNLSSSSNSIKQLMNQINLTCDALLGALEVQASQIGQYGGGVLQSFDSEFVDRVVKSLLKVKLHTQKIAKELENGLISNQTELTYLVEGLLHTIDQLDTIMLADGFMRNNFAFLIEEITSATHSVLEDITIGITA